MILVTIAVLMADTTPLTRTDAVTVDVNGSTVITAVMLQNTIDCELLLQVATNVQVNPGITYQLQCIAVMVFVKRSISVDYNYSCL